MSQHDWADDASPLSRRDFVARLAAVGGGFAIVGTSACGGGSPGGAGIVEPPPTGNITGLVSSLEGAPQSGLGTLILMNDRGRQTGQRASPDANGRF
jgi:hypothetical protein